MTSTTLGHKKCLDKCGAVQVHGKTSMLKIYIKNSLRIGIDGNP